MKKFALLTLLPVFVALGLVTQIDHQVHSEEVGSSEQQTFPVIVDFESPRNFGFHVGDEIPLTVSMKVGKGSIVDLVNLPTKKESHGPFEIRDVSIKRRQKKGLTEYRVSYRLQSFEPAIAVDRLTFPSLNISYSREKDWNRKKSKHEYQTLLSQNYDILVSRTATYMGPMKPLKGPLVDKTGTILWKAATVAGTMMILLALFTWFMDFIRKRRILAKRNQMLSSSDRAFKALQQARENCFNHDDHRKHLFFEVNAILRDFLKEVCDLDAANRPTTELVQSLKDRPYYDELNSFVARINQVVYEGDAPADLEPIVRQFSELLKNVDPASAVGVTYDQSG
jgi:hypothetical protein